MKRLSEFVPNVEEIDLDCGHWIQQELPDETTQVILNWLEQKASASFGRPGRKPVRPKRGGQESHSSCPAWASAAGGGALPHFFERAATLFRTGSEAVRFDADEGQLCVPLRRPTAKRAASEFVPIEKGHDLDTEWFTGEPLCG